LRELDELLVESGDFLDQLIELRRWLDAGSQQANRGAEEAFFRSDGDCACALDAFDQNFDVAVRKL
jgi:hypothetical protein